MKMISLLIIILTLISCNKLMEPLKPKFKNGDCFRRKLSVYKNVVIFTGDADQLTGYYDNVGGESPTLLHLRVSDIEYVNESVKIKCPIKMNIAKKMKDDIDLIISDLKGEKE